MLKTPQRRQHWNHLIKLHFNEPLLSASVSFKKRLTVPKRLNGGVNIIRGLIRRHLIWWVWTAAVSSKTPYFRSFTVACAAVVSCRVQLTCRAAHVCYWRRYFTGDTMEQPGSSHHIRWQQLTNRLECTGNWTRPKPVRPDSLALITANNLTVGFYNILHEIWWRATDSVRENPRMHEGHIHFLWNFDSTFLLIIIFIFFMDHAVGLIL